MSGRGTRWSWDGSGREWCCLRSDAGGLLPFVEENALQMDAQALRALEEEPEGAQFLAMATCSGEYTDARTVVLARMEPMSDLQNGKEESLS